MSFDQVDFANSLRTVGWNTAAVQGFEQDAYGATLLLIHFIDPPDARGKAGLGALQQHGQRRWATRHPENKRRLLPRLAQSASSWCLWDGIRQRKCDETAFRVSSPWSLNDAEFTYCMLYIKTGRAPDPAKFEKRFLSPNAQMIAGKVEDALKKKALEYLQKGAIAVGGAAVETFFKIKGSTVGGLVLDVGWNLLSDQLAKVQLADLTARYAIDETRRIYLVPNGLSAYQQISGL